MTSSVDPTAEMAAIAARLTALGAPFYDGVPQGAELDKDGFGNLVPYRDMQPGGVTPSARQRLLAAEEQSQPYVWAFQIAHVASSRSEAVNLSIETDKTLIGWAPTTNASKIGTFFFTVYDEFAKEGERVKWIATRFYETTLGQNPDLA